MPKPCDCVGDGCCESMLPYWTGVYCRKNDPYTAIARYSKEDASDCPCPDSSLDGLACAEKRGMSGCLCVCACHAVENQMVAILKAACDHSWKDETPLQVANIAANAIYWRDREIAHLRGELANAAAHVNDTLSTLKAMRGDSDER